MARRKGSGAQLEAEAHLYRVDAVGFPFVDFRHLRRGIPDRGQITCRNAASLLQCVRCQRINVAERARRWPASLLRRGQRLLGRDPTLALLSAREAASRSAFSAMALKAWSPDCAWSISAARCADRLASAGPT